MGTKVPLMLLFAVSLHIHQSHLIISLKINGESSVKIFNCGTFPTYHRKTPSCSCYWSTHFSTPASEVK